jgi:hypothetical protein
LLRETFDLSVTSVLVIFKHSSPGDSTPSMNCSK